MKKVFLLIVTTILSLNCYSQIVYEKGYYIDNANQKIICQIKNMDWKYNPTIFEYILAENGKPRMATINTVKEFGIDNVSKFIRSKVNMDRSSENVNNLSSSKEPIFKEEVLFLGHINFLGIKQKVFPF